MAIEGYKTTTIFDKGCIMKKKAIIDTDTAAATGGCSCLACHYAPRAWTRFERIGGGIWHEGRCRKLRQTVRADKTDCCRWAAKEETSNDKQR